MEPAQISTAARFLEFILLDPVSRSIATASKEEKTLTAEAVQAIEASKAGFHQNKGIPHEEILAEFGIEPDSFSRKAGDSDPCLIRLNGETCDLV